MRKGAPTSSTKADGVSSYARGKWAASDAAFCDQMDAVQSLDVRADVLDAMLRVLRRCHASMWPASHWTKERKAWHAPYRGRALPAFRASLRELSALTGLTVNRVRTALRVAEEHGVIVRLSDPVPRGEGRGSVPATYAFSCYVQRADQPKPAKPKEPTSGTGKAKGEDAARRTAAKWGVGDQRPRT